jgi:hypothetical protein
MTLREGLWLQLYFWGGVAMGVGGTLYILAAMHKL